MSEAAKKDANVVTHLQSIARMVDEELPEGFGFILMAFPFGDKEGRINYVAKCNRDDAINVLKSWLAKQENPEDFGKHV